ncbi:hypothetical protein PSAB6_10006 [Paraburkholderia sabiae]|uniref:beta strand repeat-containing protein n=1 Tax=Paraburkholderia sabiae TaxID=273251 RepID=UPI001CAC9C7F|nr:hypothetical protein [Paraburkholderia sabiae]CAG9188878.1 hypothetical protein PSAB6_10006 [Paraburkholderia sabiae]
MSNPNYQVTSDATFTMDNATFDVLNGGSLNLTGSSDTITMESNNNFLSVTGNGNTIIGSNAIGAEYAISGTGNVATLGVGAWGWDFGDNNTITLATGAGLTQYGTGTTFNATQGGASMNFNGQGVANANNDTINLYGGTAQVNGSGNQIGLWQNSTLNVQGSNNAISFDIAAGREVVQTATASMETNGDIVLGGSTNLNCVTLTGSIATVQLDNGNVAAISGVKSGSTIEYVDGSGAVTSRVLTDSGLVNRGGSLYDVTANVSLYGTMDNATFDVLNGGSLNLTGSSDTITMESNNNFLSVTGNGNTIIGSNAIGAEYAISGTGNVATLGVGAWGWDFGDNNTITLATGADLTQYGTGTTFNATQGGARMNFDGQGVANANNDTINLYGGTAQVNGSGNQIGLWANSTLNVQGSNNAVSLVYYADNCNISLNGGNNTISDSGSNGIINLGGSNNTVNLYGSNNKVSFDARAGAQLIQTAAGDVVEEDANGSISVSSGTGSYAFSITKNGFVTLGFSDGNTVQISSVRSSSNGGGLTNNQVSQLVSAMASYQNDAAGVSSALMTQSPADTSLFASSHH